MRILILTQYFPPEVGAPQNRLYELAVRMKNKGADITVLTAMPNYPQMEIHGKYRGLRYFYEEINGLKVHRAAIYVSKKRGIISRLKNYFSFVMNAYRIGKRKLGDFDFVLCESPPLFLGITAVRLARKKNARLIFNVSDLWPESAEKLGIVKNRLLLGMSYRLEKWIYERSFLIPGQTQGIVKSIASRFPGKRTYWLPNGVDLNYYDPGSTAVGWRTGKDYSDDDFIVLYAGIIGHAYKFELLLDSAVHLKENSRIRFAIVGSGPEKQRTVMLKEKMALPNVSFFDTVSKQEMPVLLKSVDAIVIPLRKTDLSEGTIPSKIFEALAMKKPVLLGVEGEAKELFITEGKCGLFFEPENANDLTRKILELYNNRELLLTLGENGRKYVNEKFNRDKIADQFWSLITSFK